MGVIQRRDRDSNLSVVTPLRSLGNSRRVRVEVFFVRVPRWMEIVYDDLSKRRRFQEDFPRSNIRFRMLSFFTDHGFFLFRSVNSFFESELWKFLIYIRIGFANQVSSIF